VPFRRHGCRLDWPAVARSISQLLGTSDRAAVEAAVHIYRERYATVGWCDASVYEGVPTMLGAMRRSGFVATSKAHVFAERALAHFGLASHFQRIYGPDLQGQPAGKVELLQQLIRDERIDDVLIIGDRGEDMHAATKNGLRAIGVLWGYGSERELLEAGASAVCASPAELAVYVAGL
jgi:phosphoglycolate phosphatase